MNIGEAFRQRRRWPDDHPILRVKCSLKDDFRANALLDDVDLHPARTRPLRRLHIPGVQ